MTQVPDRDAVFHHHGRVHPVLRVVLAQCVYVATLMVLMGPLVQWWVATHPEASPQGLWDWLDRMDWVLFVAVWVQAVTTVAVALALTRWLDRQPVRALGLWQHPGWQRELAAGFALGVFLVGAIFLALRASGLASIRLSSGGVTQLLGVTVGLLLPMAFSEEIWFRAYIQRNLTQALGPWASLGITSAFFAVAHFQNPEKSALGFFNIALAGAALGYAYLRSGSLWLPVGWHFAWNATQGVILGMPVSGVGLPGLLQTDLRIPNWLSGGSFGPEGGLVATAAIAVAFAYVVRRYHGDLTSCEACRSYPKEGLK